MTQNGKWKKKIGVHSGDVSRRIYNQRRWLVTCGLASWYLPYKPLDDITGI